ncbi:hypothetical protein, unlikely [Trypanosoma brucei gambiense DAL972]|uniref:Uncharacterized protein n=1 Tax=Trypanosoma brucei gambiense (strain MHOM/CI/86/DAL972) TaxID=679716 RepID=D0A0L2_TRYB9|nr:hypothetical protein, unlikely [Trypanosoma brucei gambiense DAL972]CBH16770.1 hypothetical protein, unlikely [Trypanosoma brucei gambiense DAL972]|eukprot:XP_011779034.1 hypothetical protein, unlikely [Trypanosoma brucei gambiense DAL972]
MTIIIIIKMLGEKSLVFLFLFLFWFGFFFTFLCAAATHKFKYCRGGERRGGEKGWRGANKQNELVERFILISYWCQFTLCGALRFLFFLFLFPFLFLVITSLRCF